VPLCASHPHRLGLGNLGLDSLILDIAISNAPGPNRSTGTLRVWAYEEIQQLHIANSREGLQGKLSRARVQRFRISQHENLTRFATLYIAYCTVCTLQHSHHQIHLSNGLQDSVTRMTPNLLVATQTLFSPHKWFKPSNKVERPKRKHEHWDAPIPGIYEYIPGRGWYLVATDKIVATNSSHDINDPKRNNVIRETVQMTQPIQVKYSKVLKEYLLAPDYEMRKRHGKVQNERGRWYDAGFFRLNDGVAWVECWDEEGEFIPGPYKLWCIDQRTGNFRHMLKGDDPKFAPSRQNSVDGTEGEKKRTSQDSRSTQYRSGVGATRDGQSVPSTRANSIKALTPGASVSASHTPSQPGSRRGSPKRSPNLHFEEAKERLRVMAAEQAAAAKSNGNSSDERRGRPGAPIRNPSAE
jgi:hypothetical protein